MLSQTKNQWYTLGKLGLPISSSNLTCQARIRLTTLATSSCNALGMKIFSTGTMTRSRGRQQNVGRNWKFCLRKDWTSWNSAYTHAESCRYIRYRSFWIFSSLWSSEMCIFKLWDSECPILTWSRVANILLIASLRQNMSVQLSVALTFGRAGQSFFCWKGCVSRLCLWTQASALVDSHLPTNRSNEGCVQAVPISPRVNCNDSAWFGQLFHDPTSRTCWSPHTKGLLCWPTAPEEACHTLLESWTITPFLVRHVSGGSSPCRSNASVWLSERYRTVQVSIMSPPVTMQGLSLSCKSFENPAELEVLKKTNIKQIEQS